MTEEHKKKIKEGREKAKKLREAGVVLPKKNSKKAFKNVFDKPIVQYTGEEKDAFDFIPLVRAAFRRQHNYLASPKIVHEITDKRFWQNVPWILSVLEKYVILEKEDSSAPKKARRKRKPMTEEQRLEACERLKKAREARNKK